MGGTELDTALPTGKLMLTVFRAIVAFERELMSECQR
jgi:DNA invertase Pin-like site-specific DNA recombinase